MTRPQARERNYPGRLRRRDARGAQGAGAAADAEWVLQESLGAQHPVAVHVGGRHMAGEHVRGITREQALRPRVEGVDGCGHCGSPRPLGTVVSQGQPQSFRAATRPGGWLLCVIVPVGVGLRRRGRPRSVGVHPDAVNRGRHPR
ncbi:DUF6233 domain-containing protein [Streptomyces himalayensis]|uniref:DUF6233 domain-containing protein n=1 Tax=Streptomyces himalayensis TaxID=2820085 RepID=UPI0035E46277